MFLPIVLSLCMVQFGAFAATARGNARGANNTSDNSASAAAPVAARAATRNTVKNTNAAPAQPAAAQPVAARAGNRQKVVSNPSASAGQPMAARAGATQKVINNGTKVATATSNTVISQECQDAFYGCMDSFCMIDNVSGGRCQCSDRHEELVGVMDEIAKLDEQSYIMATEGVERIQMGEAEADIMARAKATAEKVSSQDKEENKKKARTLDLSAWNNSVFSEETAFDEVDNSALNDAMNKTGAALYNSAAKLCVAQMPTQCSGSLNMLQSVYAQKIKSDCVAFENSLKQQKIASTQKLQTAQKALRDAALDEYKNQNKYATTGECVVAFTQCMQTTAGCGNDYTSCVTLAAKENVANNKNGQKAKQTTIKSAVAGANITLAATTMEALLAKKEICRSVTKQCVNSNKNDEVWTMFLRNAAPALKSAEEIAEQDLRMNCIPSLAECFQKACKSNIDPKDADGSYDMCLSNPATYKSLCKVQLEPCLAATGGTYEKPTESSLWNGLLAALNAMKVDACTTEVKSCLTADTACGEDYSGCVGLDSEAILNICPVEKLTACQKDSNYEDAAAIKAYVARVAQGIALNIDNSMLTTCQNAVNTAMINACGSKDECAKMALDKNIGATTLDYKVCQVIVGNDRSGKQTLTVNKGACKDDSSLITKEEMGLATLSATDKQTIGSIYSGEKTWGFGIITIFGGFGGGDTAKQTKINYIDKSEYSVKPGETIMYTPMIFGQIDWGTSLGTNATYDSTTGIFTNKLDESDSNYEFVQNVVESLNTSMKRVISSIESDAKVQYCMTGREVQGFSEAKSINSKDSKARFPNLTDSIRQIIANQVLTTAMDNYNNKMAEFESKRDKDYANISSKYAEVAAENDEKQLQQRLATNCNALNRDNSDWNYKETVTAVYNESSRTCTKTSKTQKCKTTKNASNPGKRYCQTWDEAKETTEQLQM